METSVIIGMVLPLLEDCDDNYNVSIQKLAYRRKDDKLAEKCG